MRKACQDWSIRPSITYSSSFLEASSDLPQSPDPHLGLARADLLAALPGDALAELDIAERLGHQLGARELDERAAAYRLRGFEEMQAGNVEAARLDFAAAGQPMPEVHKVAKKPVRKPRPRRWR